MRPAVPMISNCVPVMVISILACRTEICVFYDSGIIIFILSFRQLAPHCNNLHHILAMLKLHSLPKL